MTGEWRLQDVEFDVLWRGLGFGAPPYPLELPSPGTTHEERDRIEATVATGLADSGLAGEDGTPLPELAGALTLLATSEVLIDAHLVLTEHVRVAATRAGERAA